MGDLRIDGVTCMREYGGMWVFVRNRIEMLQALEWMEEYTAECYISSFTKIRLYIDTVLRKKDGSVAVASRLELCALDLETGRIRKAATVGVGEKTPPQEPSGDVHEVVYSKVKLLNLKTDSEVTYKIVGSNEANPSDGKISDESPVGLALLGHSVGDAVEVEVPVGVIGFKVLDIFK